MSTFNAEAIKLFNQAASCAVLIGASLAQKSAYDGGNMEFLLSTGPNTTEKYWITCNFRHAHNRCVIDEVVLPVARATLDRLSNLPEGAIQAADLPNLPFTAAVLDAIQKTRPAPHIYFSPVPPSGQGHGQTRSI